MSERFHIERCPVCGRGPYFERVEPWDSKEYGPAPWAVGCYGLHPIEHFVGVNGDTQTEARRAWNDEAKSARNPTR